MYGDSKAMAASFDHDLPGWARAARWLPHIATGALALVAIALYQRSIPAHDPLSRLLDAANAADRGMEPGRIAGVANFLRPNETRGAATKTASTLRLKTVAAEILETSELRKSRKPVDLHTIAVAYFFAGNVDEAIRTLTDLSRLPHGRASAWNDLAAALLVRGKRDNDPRDLARAVVAADHALDQEPVMAPALYNRLVALEELGLEQAARAAAQTYLRVDSGSSWAMDVRRRLVRVERPTAADEWKIIATRIERLTNEGLQAELANAAARYPQLLRSWAEGEIIGRWADAIAAQDAQAAHRWLDIARAAGSALAARSGDTLLAEIVDDIDHRNEKSATAVAQTFREYRKGRQLFAKRFITESLPFLTNATRRFRAEESPLWLLAAYYEANALLDAYETAASRRVLAEVLAAAQPRYESLRAMCAWGEANLLLRDGRLYEALLAWRRALEGFKQLDERNHAARMQNNAAATLTLLGRRTEAWRLRHSALRGAMRSGDPLVMDVVLNGTVRQAVREHEWAVARSLLHAAIEQGIGSPRLRADALLWRAFADARLRGAVAPADLSEARRAAESLADGNLRDEASYEVRFAEAITLRNRDPQRALALLDDVIAWRERKQRRPEIALAHVERARIQRVLGRDDDAIADLRRAIDLIEVQRATIPSHDIRDTFFGSASDAYEELADLYASRNDLDRAFAVAEQMRARTLLDRETSSEIELSDAEAIQRRLPRNLQIVHYTTWGRRTMVVAFGERGRRAVVLEHGRNELERLREALVAAISSGREADARRDGRRLYEILFEAAQIDPYGPLVIVPDDALMEVPFAALIDRDGRYLIERCDITLAASATTFMRHAATQYDQRRNDRVLVVTDPAFSASLFPGLPRLHAAAGESQELVGVLPNATVLTGDNATRQRVLDLARSSSVVHIAAHAMVDRLNPQSSFLVLAPDGSDHGLLYHRDVVDVDFKATRLVVLAGCRTASLSEAPGSLRSLATAFIAAGAHAVAASLWDIDDEQAADLATRFYRHLASGQTAASALRLAQIEMLHSNDARHRSVRAWAALQIYGNGF
ncbi:MAG TPA: CHAT domain-containing protein [Thermoanaerobaculia bacterium]|nr:CHAT domain-containing protein [Thermoanaerobaculia bacterium]